MTIIIPKGIPFEIPQGQRLIGKLLFPERIEAMQTTFPINPSEYALVQEGDTTDSAVSMSQILNGKGNFWDLHKDLYARGLKGMDARKFLPHLYSINEAVQGRRALYDTSGNLIEGERLSRYAQTSNHNSWAYLNGHFQPSEQGKPEGFRGLDLLSLTGFEGDKPLFSRVQLETCLEEDCWADVTPESLNGQGFPTKKSPIGDKYEPGKTALFWYPRKNAVVRFYANSGWAYFICNGNPAVRDDALGVFASADEGSASVAKKSGTEVGIGVVN